MTTKIHGTFEFGAAGDTMGGLFVYKVVCGAALVSNAAGTGTGDLFLNAIGNQPVIWSVMTATGFSIWTEHAISAAQDTAATAVADVTSVTDTTAAWQLA